MVESEIAITIVLTTLLILILIAGITIAFFSINKEKVKRQVEKAEQELQFEKELRKMESEVGEGLMQHFSQEMHDNVGHLLTCLRLELENRKLDNPTLADLLKQTDEYLDQTIEQTRMLSRSWNNDHIERLGLNGAIQLEIERQRQLKRLEINWEDHYGANPLDKNLELTLFRIFQEILTNTIKHSGANMLAIVLKGETEFELYIKDNGKGFNLTETLAGPQASGLHNILRRSEMAGALCNINTAPGKGCEYTIQLKKKEENDQ